MLDRIMQKFRKRFGAGERKYFSQCGQDKWVVEEIFNFKRGGVLC